MNLDESQTDSLAGGKMECDGSATPSSSSQAVSATPQRRGPPSHSPSFDRRAPPQRLPLDPALALCLTGPIQAHAKLVDRTAVQAFLARLRLSAHLETLRRYFCFQSGFIMEELTRQWFEGLARGYCWADAGALNHSWWLARQGAAADPHALTGFEDCISFGVLPGREPPKPHLVTALDHIQIRYAAGFPLNIVLTARCTEHYGQLFRLLVKLKRAEYALRSMFLHGGKAVQSPLMHGFSIFRFKLQSFVRILQGYLLHHGLDSGPSDFERKLAENAFTSLDDMRTSHAAMLDGVLDRCLLRPSQKPIMTIVDAILALVIKLGIGIQNVIARQRDHELRQLSDGDESDTQSEDGGGAHRPVLRTLDRETTRLLTEVLAQQDLFAQYLDFLAKVLQETLHKGGHDHLDPLLRELQRLLNIAAVPVPYRRASRPGLP